MSGYSLQDVTFHHDHGRSRPAVNIKVRRWPQDVTLPNPEYDIDDPEFTHEWIDKHLSDDQLSDYFWFACSSELEYLEAWAREIFDDPDLKLYTEGRSGGWAVIDQISDTEGWDAIDLAKWRKFERIAKQLAHDIPETTLSLIFINEFQHEKEAEEQRAAHAAWLYRARSWAFTRLHERTT